MSSSRRLHLLGVCAAMGWASGFMSAGAELLPQDADIHSRATVTHPVAEAVSAGIFGQDFMHAFVHQPEEAAVHLRAQLAISVWYSDLAFNEVAARQFIFRALRAACDLDREPTVWAPTGRNCSSREILNEYALTYSMTLEEVDAWWERVGQHRPRDEWARLLVEWWLPRREAGSRRLLALMHLTRNLDPILYMDTDAFEAWWRRARLAEREAWVPMLIDRALDALSDEGREPHRPYGYAKEQLLHLLPQQVSVRHGIGLRRGATEADRERYLHTPLDPEALGTLKRWWARHRQEYGIPVCSPFREPHSREWEDVDRRDD